MEMRLDASILLGGGWKCVLDCERTGEFTARKRIPLQLNTLHWLGRLDRVGEGSAPWGRRRRRRGMSAFAVHWRGYCAQTIHCGRKLESANVWSCETTAIGEQSQ